MFKLKILTAVLLFVLVLSGCSDNQTIENNIQIKEDIVKEKTKESNSLILQLKKENEKILNEYEHVVKKNLN